ncbi:MAG: hypothetical protein CBD26_03830 [Candidatus Pelagibacter sp. TMED166]|nr:MAG: hypothetical protein CBD26_03830 [Candidatus Pelagibacter sp. TMED166]|tara:strand:- start:3636 stop:4367 length:732 start_codon:yes stop_codon:yes gene_type:complete
MNNLNKTYYIFDVDGTLTKPRQKADNRFVKKFISWSAGKNLVLATGSDFSKVREQIPQNMLSLFELVFCCMANELRDSSGELMRTNHFKPEKELIQDLKNFLIKSKYNTKTGNHIEHRTGMINFSVVGRDASDLERRLYNLWDKKYKERQKIADFLRNKYPELNVSIGGSISIDISPMGFDKSQVVEYLVQNKDVEEIAFFGDKTDPGGNDYGLITSLDRYNIESFRWHKVNGPKHLSELLNL